MKYCVKHKNKNKTFFSSFYFFTGVEMGLDILPKPTIRKLTERDVYVIVRMYGVVADYKIIDEDNVIPESYGKLLVDEKRDINSFRRILLWKKEIVKDGWETVYMLSAVIDPENSNELVGLSTIDRHKYLHKSRKLTETETVLFFEMFPCVMVRTGYRGAEKVYEDVTKCVYEPISVFIVEDLEKWTKNHPEFQRWIQALTVGVK
jgi:hypothetical protein